MATGPLPTEIGGPAVLVAVVIGVTVPEAMFATYAVLVLGEPPDKESDAGACAAACTGTTEPGPASDEISVIATTPNRSSARRAVVIVDIAYPPPSTTLSEQITLLLAVTERTRIATRVLGECWANR